MISEQGVTPLFVMEEGGGGHTPKWNKRANQD